MEFALILPVFLLLLLIMLEFGLAYSQRLTLSHATREGARTGSALAKGGATNCILPDPAGVDQQIIAALQRIVKSPGSDVVLDDIDEVRIYKSDAAGGQVGGFVNIWDYAAGAGLDIDPGVLVDRLDFVERSNAWPACSRNNGASPDSIGVRIVYTYRLTTPLAGVVQVMGGSQAGTLPMDDQTIMALNPTS